MALLRCLAILLPDATATVATIIAIITVAPTITRKRSFVFGDKPLDVFGHIEDMGVAP